MNRLWPDELVGYLERDNAVEILPASLTQVCRNCGGSGMMMLFIVSSGPHRYPTGKCKWFDYVDADGKPDSARSGWYNGEMKIGSCPVCQSGRMEAYLLANCGLKDSDLEIRLSGFDTGGMNAGKRPAYETAGALLGQNRDAAGFVTFVGGYGVGKSHLLKALVNGFRSIRVVSHYNTMSGLLAEIRARFGDDNGVKRVEDVIDYYSGARVLAVDEVDRVNLTGWAQETVFRLLDARYTERESLLTVMATNTDPARFAAELGYVASRINGGLVVPVPGPDMRPAARLTHEYELVDHTV
jgi:DNA replication protein DnaC